MFVKKGDGVCYYLCVVEHLSLVVDVRRGHEAGDHLDPLVVGFQHVDRAGVDLVAFAFLWAMVALELDAVRCLVPSELQTTPNNHALLTCTRTNFFIYKCEHKISAKTTRLCGTFTKSTQQF